MDNSSLIQKIQEHIAIGKNDAYTSEFLRIARNAIAEMNSMPNQHKQLVKLVEELENLQNTPPEISIFGHSSVRMS